jgi:hypothetical protein
MGIDPGDFYMHAKPDSNLRPWYSILFLQPRQATAQRIEIDGLLKISRRTRLFAIPLGVGSGFAAH